MSTGLAKAADPASSSKSGSPAPGASVSWWPCPPRRSRSCTAVRAVLPWCLLGDVPGRPDSPGRAPVPAVRPAFSRAGSSHPAAARLRPAAWVSWASWAAGATGAAISAAMTAAAGPLGGAAADGPGWPADGVSVALAGATPAGTVFVLRATSVIPLFTFPALFPGRNFFSLMRPSLCTAPGRQAVSALSRLPDGSIRLPANTHKNLSATARAPFLVRPPVPACSPQNRPRGQGITGPGHVTWQTSWPPRARASRTQPGRRPLITSMEAACHGHVLRPPGVR
jgi:hypothetical protein